MANTLIVRYERIGDALLVLPLVINLASKYKNDTFTVLTNKRFDNLLQLMPPNVTFISMVSKTSKGLFRGPSYLKRRWLFLRETKKTISKFDKIAFLQYGTFEKEVHKYIQKKRLNISVAITDQKEFRSAERAANHCSDGLTMIGLHKNVLAKLDYTDLNVTSEPSAIKQQPIASTLISKLNLDTSKKLVAISPFSREEPKVYPLDTMEKVIAHFAALTNEYQVLILGGGEDEKLKAEEWTAKYPSVISLITRISFGEEISIISKCQVVVSMDSSNMHLASLLHTPVVSVWGPTTPQCGYYPARERHDRAIVKGMPCQPCSIFGERECTQTQKFACMDIAPKVIIDKIKLVINQEDDLKKTRAFIDFIQELIPDQPTTKSITQKEKE